MTSTATSKSTITGVAPMFLVDDVAKTAEWYRDHFGFEIGDYFREHHHPHDEPHDESHHDESLGEPVFVILRRDGHRLMLGKTVEPGLGVRSNYDFKEYSGDAYFWVENIDALYEGARAAGASFMQGIETQPYGVREFRLKDCDGRVLTFGELVP